MSRLRRTTTPLALALLVATTLGTLTTACSGGGSSKDSASADATTTVAPTTTLPPTTTTTVDPGTLPQTDEKPTTTGAVFDAHMKALADAIIADDPSLAEASFFPLEAYKQTKAIPNPPADWQSRLIANYRVDIDDAHKLLGPNAKSAVFQGVRVPDTAVWVTPGQEYNKGPYWRVFKTQMDFAVDGRTVSIPIESMISWRGQWYVVHLGRIR